MTCHRWAFAVALLVGAPACEDSGGVLDEGNGDDSAEPMACPGGGGTLAGDEPCVRNVDCASGVCSIFADAPVNSDAVCVAAPEDCSTMFTGTVLDFATRAPVANVPVNMTTAGAAVDDVLNAPVLLQPVSDEAGRYSVTSNGPILDAPLAILAFGWTENHVLTVSGLAQPSPVLGGYEVGAGLHEVWLVPVQTLVAWDEELRADEGIDPSWLPLSEVGAIVGRVRDPAGQPIAGAEVVSANGGSPTVRYVADDGTLTGEVTGASGEFLVFGTAPVETFAAFANGAEVGRATLGVVPGATFVTVLQAVQ